MANPMKGEAVVRVEAGEFTLAYTLGAAIAIEAEFNGKPLGEILAGMQERQDATSMLRVIWAGLRKHHNLDLDHVAEIVTIAEMSVWSEAIGRALSDPEPDTGERSRPQKAKTKAG